MVFGGIRCASSNLPCSKGVVGMLVMEDGSLDIVFCFMALRLRFLIIA